MLIEHLIYSTAFAIFIGMIHYRFFNRDYSWIIIASAYAPDLDLIFNSLLGKIGITVLVNWNTIEHGYFHNIVILTLYATCMAFLLHPFGFKFVDSIFFAGIGFAAHLFEDALVFKDGYSYFWPLMPQHLGIGLFNYTPNFYGFADKEVLIIGLILLVSSAILRTAYEGTRWVANYLPMSGAISSRKEH
jgi:Predicted membrane-bound metal-dependent hydrolase (DUF457).